MNTITVRIQDIVVEPGKTIWDKFVNHCFKRGLIDVDYDHGEISLNVVAVKYVSEIYTDVPRRIQHFNRICRMFEKAMVSHDIKVSNDGEECDIHDYPFRVATKTFSLIQGRSLVQDYIFEKSDVDIDLRYYPYLVDKACEKIKDLYGITLYVKGPTIALVAIQEACQKMNCKLTLKFYNHFEDRWIDESVLKYRKY